jgi:carbonic anhydrase
MTHFVRIGVILLIACIAASLKFQFSRVRSSSALSAGKSPEFEEYFNRPGPWDDRDLNPLFNGNREWISRMKRENFNTFSEFKKGHAPKILWIGCADARVPANEMIGEPPGSVFVHRNIANLVVNTDMNAASVIQYAVDYLKVKHIVVCGHYDCGGVRAATNNMDHQAPLENWVRNIRDNYRLHKDELLAISDEYARYRRLVELNVIEQVSLYNQSLFVDTYPDIRFLVPKCVQELISPTKTSRNIQANWHRRVS